MEINYELIIKYLCKSESKVEKKITKPKEKNNFMYFQEELNEMFYLDFNFENSFLVSIIFLLNNEKFYIDNSKMSDSIDEMLNELNLTNDSNIKVNICKEFNINILLIGDELKLFSYRNIIDLSLPFILLYEKDNEYYPIYEKNRKVFFYHNSLVENLLDNEFKVNHDDYQLLDDIEYIIDDILKKETNEVLINNIFTNESIVNNMESYKKMKKSELIDKLLDSNTSLKKSKLNKLKKNDLIKILLS